jgi:hypothetical protein
MTLAAPARAGRLESFLPPDRTLMDAIVRQLDLRSTNFGLRHPRPGGYAKHFLDLRGMRVVSRMRTSAELQWANDWHIEITILGRGDYNQDGIEDVYLCVEQDAKPAGGTLVSVEPVTLTRYSNDGPLIAIAYVHADDRCRPFEH